MNGITSGCAPMPPKRRHIRTSKRSQQLIKTTNEYFTN